MICARPQRLIAEFVGTTLLLATVVGSGIMAERLAGGNAALALLGNTLATGAMLYVLITILGPVSGAHFNPAVSIAALLSRQLRRREPPVRANSRLVTKPTIYGRHVEIGILGTSAADRRTRCNCGASIFRRRRFRISRLFYRSRCCQPPCDASAQGHRAQIWSHQELARARRLCYSL